MELTPAVAAFSSDEWVSRHSNLLKHQLPTPKKVALGTASRTDDDACGCATSIYQV